MIGKKINQLATELAPVSTDLTIIGDPDSGVSKKITLAQLGAIFSGAVSFYTNLASFPVVGDINVIYCAKDTQKLYLWSGSAYVEVFPSQALLNTYQLRSEKGVSNGYASLDSGGKVPISQLPSSIMEYKGTWNAATNTPTLANGTGDTGDVYICNVAGTVNFGAGPITFAVGDYVIYSGTIWQRSSGAVGTVTSVAASITGNAIGITGSPVTTSGTLAFAFAGNSTQYVNGAGNLVTFPGVINEAQNLITEVYNKTGATLTKGTVVYINGGQGNLPAVTKALATGDSTSAQTYGIVQNDITNNNNGYVVVAGRISDLDTQAFTEGTQLYLSSTTAGGYTSTKQYAPNHLVYVGIVVRAHPTQGVIEVKIQNGYEMDELHNVAAQTPTNNDGLFWESATSLWKNKSIATVLGYTPQAQLNGTGFVKASGTTITYDNSTYLTTSAASTTYLPMVLSSTANFVDINGQQFSIYGSAGGFTSGRIIVDPLFSALGYQNTGVFNGLKILTNGNAEFTNSGVTRFFNQVRFDSTLTNGTYTYTLPGATGTIALVGGAGVGTVTSVGLSSATSGVTIGSTPITTSGTITLAIATASGSQQGLLSSTDWTTFNNKQNALTNPVTGTGTTNYLPKFTGASTIGNSAIFENGTNVGINTASPSSYTNLTTLTINGTNGSVIDLKTGNTLYGEIYSLANELRIDAVGASSVLKFLTNSATKATIDTLGNLMVGSTDAGNAGSVNISVGLAGTTSGGLQLWAATNQTHYIQFGDGTTGASPYTGYVGYAHSTDSLIFGTATATKMTLTSSGNLGLGVTPANSSYKNIQNGLAVMMGSSADAGAYWNANGTFDSGWKYIVNGASSRYEQGGGGHSWYNAPSGTAGNAISFTQAMTLNASGNLGIGSTSPTQGKLVVSGGVTNSIATISASFGTNNALNIGDDGTNAVLGVGNSGTDMVFLKRVAGVYSEAMRITSGGNVGIGTTSPQSKFEVVDGTGSVFRAITSGTNIMEIGNYKAGGAGYQQLDIVSSIVTIGTGTAGGGSATERMRIKSTGIINLSNVPSSSAGLSSGDIYKSAGVLMIV